MNFRRFFIFILLVSLTFLLFRCAQVVPLTGGAKDTKAPELLSVFPANRSVNIAVKGAKIVFKFNELVSAQNASQKLIINPLTDEMPDLTVNGKTLTVEFIKELLPNTTYFLQFGNSIADIHENNPFPNLNYLFSTGPAIDSAYITGEIVDALSQKPVSDVSVWLYKNLTDSALLTSKPDYLTKTNDKGNYFLSAIKYGTYRAVAVADKNKNLMYDLSETMAFSDSPINVFNDTLNFRLSTAKSEKLYIKKKIQSFWGFNRYVLNDTFPGVYFITEKSIDEDKYNYEVRNDTLEVYYKNIYERNFSFIVKNGTKAFDTVNLDIPSQTKVDSTVDKGTRKIGFRAEKPTYSILHDPLIFNFSLPVKKLNEGFCYLLRDSIKESPVFTSENLNEDNALVTTFLPSYKKRLKNKLLPQKTYTLVCLPKSIETFWGTFNKDTLKTSFKTAGADETGNLTVKAQVPDSTKNYVVQILDEKGVLRAEKAIAGKLKSEINFYNLPAGEYKTRVIFDIDGNGKFSPAMFLKHQQPEKVIYHEKSIKILAGWDIESEWKIATISDH